MTVCYDPLEHAKSVLIPGVNKYTRLSFAIVPICWAMALVFWLGLR